METETPETWHGYVVRTCQTCQGRMLSSWLWCSVRPPQRAEFKAAGFVRGQRHDKCRQCSERVRRRAERAEHESTGWYRRDDLLAEWEHLHDRSLSVRANCKVLAPRLGMKPDSMARALQRAGVRTMASAA